MITLNDVVNVFTIISLVVASSVALYGLNTWKEQTKRKFDWKLARRTLRAVFEVRDAIIGYRDPIISIEEKAYAVGEVLKIRPDMEFKLSDEDKAVYGIRWNLVVNADSKLRADLIEVEAIWGKPSREKIAIIRGVARRLFAAQSDFLSRYDEVTPLNKQAYPDIYNSGTDEKPDDFSRVLNIAVEAAEGCLLEKLKL